MKKTAILALVLACIITLSACDSMPSLQSMTSQNQSSSQSSESPTEQASSGDTASPEASESAQQSQKPAGISVAEQVLLDRDGIKITLKSLDLTDAWYGPELKVLIENDSDEGITVQTRNSAVNDVMIDALISCDVQPGKKANDGISFSQADLDRAGISVIKDIEFSFHIFESETWETIFDTDTVYITTTADAGYTQKYNDAGELLYNKNGIKVVYQSVDYSDTYWGAEVFVYIENLSSDFIAVQLRDTSVNGFMIDPIFSCDVLPGKRAHDAIIFIEGDLDDNGIDTIDEMEFSLNIVDLDTWDTIDLSENVSLKLG